MCTRLVLTCIASPCDSDAPRSSREDLMLWKYRPVRVVARLGLQIGTWMNMFSNVAPPSTMSSFT